MVTQILFYFIVLILFYIWHWLAHQRLMGKMHQIRWEHHFKTFPPRKFYGDDGICKKTYGYDIPTFWQLMDPRKSTNFTIYHEGLLYGMIFIVLFIAKFVLYYSWSTVFFSFILASVMGIVGSALHSSFHVKGFHLERYQWYQQLRSLHYIHHLGNTQHNFGVLNIGFVDGIFNSIRLKDPIKTKKTEE